MRKAGTITEKSDADRFADYLLTQGISSRIDKEADGHAVWIIEEQHLEQARQYLDAFLANPADAKFQDLSGSANEIRRTERKREEQAAKNLIDPRRRWQGRHAGRFPVTISLIVISVLVAIVVGLKTKNIELSQWLYFAPFRLNPADGFLYLSPYISEAMFSGQIWRFITPIFMHGGPIHILFNMYMTYQLGALVETRRGSWRFLLIVLATALISNTGNYLYGHYWGDGAPYVAPFAGMSGVVYGIFGYAWMKSRFDSAAGIFIPPNLVVWLILWLFICMTGYIGNIANTAHVVGLLTGMAIGYAPVFWRKIGR